MIWKILKSLHKFIIYKILRQTTRGVRIAIIENSKILLIKHPYDNFWVLPGGGINKNEPSESAARRETLEEVELEITGPMKKLGDYKNFSSGKKDFVTVYVATSHNQAHSKRSLIDRVEVENKQWFQLDKLPSVSKATARRIKEIQDSNYSTSLKDW
jgi:8-oxo-dGTP pyrophosphatase MutT (NUDIX family)